MHGAMDDMCKLPTDALTARLYELRKEERALLVEFLEHLAEIDRRGAALAMGFPSLFAFCVDYLGLSRGSAYRRKEAARLLLRFPVIAEYLADGRLNLKNLVELKDVLEEARLIEILDRAAGRTEEQVKELVAALRPRPPMPDLFRRLPAKLASAGNHESRPPGGRLELFPEVAPTLVSADGAQPALPLTQAPVNVAQAALPLTLPVDVAATVPERAPAPAAPPRRATPTIEPIAAELHVLRVTVGSDFKADLDELRDELSHKFPDRGLEAVLHEAVRLALDVVRKRRRGAGKATSTEPPPPDKRYIPAAIRHAVWKRDGGRCAFVGPDGRRCNSRYQVQAHHRDPFGRKGPTTIDNVSLRCSAHNLHEAERDYGRDHMDHKIRESRRRGGRASEPAGFYRHRQATHCRGLDPDGARSSAMAITGSPTG